MVKRYAGLLLALVSLWLSIAPVLAQETTTPPTTERDARSLAERLLGFDEPYALPPLTPVYEIGDELAFWVGKTGQDTPARVSARLAAVTPNIYLWVEEGLDFDPEGLANLAGFADQIQLLMRLRDTYGQRTIIP